MGTRSGNIDPALIPYIMEKTGKTADEVLDVLNKKSGMLALSGFSSDLRDIQVEADKGNERAELALKVFADRIHKYIGSYSAKMGGVDGIILQRASVKTAKRLEGVSWRDLNSWGYIGIRISIIPRARKRSSIHLIPLSKSWSSQPMKKS